MPEQASSEARTEMAALRCLFMARSNDHDPNPQEAQRDGQGAISQLDTLQELHQDGEAGDGPPAATSPASSELTDEEVAVLCDVETSGSSLPPRKQAVLTRLIERGYVAFSQEPKAKILLTPRAHQLLSSRGVGLNES